MKKYGNTEWQYMAAMARDYASKMRSMNDEDPETGKYIYAIVEDYDRNASLALKRIYENEGVESVDIYTEQGGYQTIRINYTDGTVYNFDTNGSYDSLDDMICHEIYAYITGRIDESKSNTNMEKNKKVVRLTESKLKQIVAESVKKALIEMKNDDFSMKCLNYLEQNEYSKESIAKVANLMFKNDQWTLYDGQKELLALATDQNDKLMYSFNQKAWQYVN